MIAREWRCLCPRDTREGFLTHLHATGVSETSGLPGYLGHQILERDSQESVEITLVTFWRSLDHIVAFAGEDLEVARLYEGDEAYRIVPDTRVRHYRVTAFAPPPPTP